MYNHHYGMHVYSGRKANNMAGHGISGFNNNKSLSGSEARPAFPLRIVTTYKAYML